MSKTSSVPEEKYGGARRAALAAFSGQAIEYYDFALYGTAAALIFGKLFFPGDDPAISTMMAFATFAVGFLCRPLGGIIFGHIGDKFGRKGALVVTLLLMGGATTLIGVLPTFESVGMLAPAMLIALRVIQGLALGGEWGGATLVAIEHAPKHKRAFYGAIPQLGSPAGLLLSTVALLIVGLLPNEQFESWGWRIPFLLSAVLLGIGMFIRLKVAETPDFQEKKSSPVKSQIPLVEVIRTAPKAIIFGMMAVLLSTGGYYLINTFTTSYVITELGMDKSIGLTAQVINAIVQASLLLFVGVLGVRRSPRILVVIAATIMAGWAFPLYWLMHLGLPVAIFGGLVVATIFQTVVWAMLPTLLSSQFPAHVRYTGISLVYQGGASIGGFMPLVALLLLSVFDGSPWAVACLLSAVAIITAIGALGLTKTWNSGEHSEAEPAETGADERQKTRV